MISIIDLKSIRIKEYLNLNLLSCVSWDSTTIDSLIGHGHLSGFLFVWKLKYCVQCKIKYNIHDYFNYNIKNMA